MTLEDFNNVYWTDDDGVIVFATAVYATCLNRLSFHELLSKASEFRPPLQGENFISNGFGKTLYASSSNHWLCSPRLILGSNLVTTPSKQRQRMIFEECGWYDDLTHLRSSISGSVFKVRNQADWPKVTTDWIPLKLVQDLVPTPSKEEQQKLCL